jgi:hypothetical protein
MYQSETAPWLEFFAWNTDGSAKTDLVYNTAGISIVVVRDNLANSAALTLAAASGPTDWAAGKFWAMGGNKYRVGIATASISSFTGQISVEGTYTGGVITGVTREVSAYNPAGNPNTVAPATPTNVSDVQTAILAKLPAALVGGRIDSSVGAMASDTLTAAALATDAVTEIQSGLATQTSVDDLPTNAELATALGTADDAVLAALATVQSDTNDIQTRLPAALESGRIAAVLDSAATAALVDLIWDEPLTGATHNVATSSGKRLRQTTAFQQIDSTVVDASATTTTFVTGLTSAVDDFYNDSMLVFTDGALAGQVRAIYDYIGATKTIILEEALTSAPVNGVAFAIVSLHIHPVSQIQSGLATAASIVTLRGADSDTLKTLSDQIDTVSTNVSSIASVSREAF